MTIPTVTDLMTASGSPTTPNNFSTVSTVIIIVVTVAAVTAILVLVNVMVCACYHKKTSKVVKPDQTDDPVYDQIEPLPREPGALPFAMTVSSAYGTSTNHQKPEKLTEVKCPPFALMPSPAYGVCVDAPDGTEDATYTMVLSPAYGISVGMGPPKIFKSAEDNNSSSNHGSEPSPTGDSTT